MNDPISTLHAYIDGVREVMQMRGMVKITYYYTTMLLEVESPGVPRVGESVSIDGLLYHVYHVQWTVKRPVVLSSLDDPATTHELKEPPTVTVYLRR